MLDQLRSMVNQTLVPPPATDELAGALAASSGQVHVAYHYLREQYWRAARIQDVVSNTREATFRLEVAAAKSTVKRARENCAMIPSKKLKMNEPRPSVDEFDHVHDPQQDGSLVSSTIANVISQVAAPQHLAAAHRLLLQAIEHRTRDEQYDNGGISCGVDVMIALGVDPESAIEKHLEQTADAIALWVVADTEECNEILTSQNLNAIVSAVALLPSRASTTSGVSGPRVI
jgi:hypothetical protein